MCFWGISRPMAKTSNGLDQFLTQRSPESNSWLARQMAVTPAERTPPATFHSPFSHAFKLTLTRNGKKVHPTIMHKIRTPDALNCLEITAVHHVRLNSTTPLLASNGSILTASRPFNSLFKVLFIFPSRYLFAIGLVPIFSFRWNLPPIFGCIPKQPDSWRTLRIGMPRHAQRGSHPLWHPVPRNLNVCRASSKVFL